MPTMPGQKESIPADKAVRVVRKPKRKRGTSEDDDEKERRNLHLQYRSSELVKIHIGPNKTEFAVHKPLLQKSSSYFESALGASFVEGKTGVVSLPEEEELVFGHFVEWLYRGRLTDEKDTRHRVQKQETEVLTKLYVFADRYLVPAMKLHALHELHEKFVCWMPGGFYDERDPEQESPSRRIHVHEGSDMSLPAELVTFLWNHTTEEDPMRKVLIDNLSYYLSRSTRTYEDHMEKDVRNELPKLKAMPCDLLSEVIGVLAPNIRSNSIRKPTSKRNSCEYLGHDKCGFERGKAE